MTATDSSGKKVSILTKINYIFDKKQKGQLVLLAVLILIGGVFETLGVSMMLPVVSTILVPDSLHEFIENHEWLNTAITVLGLNDDKKIAWKSEGEYNITYIYNTQTSASSTTVHN